MSEYGKQHTDGSRSGGQRPMTNTPELNVWRDAYAAYMDFHCAKTEHGAAAVIRSYGDQRYQAAIDDVVKWLGRGEDDGPLSPIANEITRRFGKGQ